MVIFLNLQPKYYIIIIRLQFAAHGTVVWKPLCPPPPSQKKPTYFLSNLRPLYILKQMFGVGGSTSDVNLHNFQVPGCPGTSWLDLAKFLDFLLVKKVLVICNLRAVRATSNGFWSERGTCNWDSRLLWDENGFAGSCRIRLSRKSWDDSDPNLVNITRMYTIWSWIGSVKKEHNTVWSVRQHHPTDSRELQQWFQLSLANETFFLGAPEVESNDKGEDKCSAIESCLLLFFYFFLRGGSLFGPQDWGLLAHCSIPLI